METKELAKLINANPPVAWLTFEVRNLQKTFSVDKLMETPIKSGSSSGHTMYDSIENMTSSILRLVVPEYDRIIDDDISSIFDPFEELEFDKIIGHPRFKED